MVVHDPNDRQKENERKLEVAGNEAYKQDGKPRTKGK